ncbi:MAG: hypothetical protein GY805_05925 [Chloroflexi bacterium]|nr:hypothetical protein [Chloroflexota bacterium]
MKFGANTWIWFAPFTFEELNETAARMAEAGFDIIELPTLIGVTLKSGVDLLAKLPQLNNRITQ